MGTIYRITTLFVGFTFLTLLPGNQACIRNFVQECTNCDVGPTCTQNGYFAHVGSQPFPSQCNDTCGADSGCTMALYRPDWKRCYMYNCTQVMPRIGFTVYRNSFSADCPRYELTIMQNYSGSCAKLSIDTGISDYNICVERCLDMDGCRGATYIETTSQCEYHEYDNASVSANTVSTVFVKRNCDIQEKDLNYTQTCWNCVMGPNCQTSYNQTGNIALDYHCMDKECRSNGDCLATHFLLKTSTCFFYNCGEVQQDAAYNRVYRKTHHADCPEYEIDTFTGSRGYNCPDIGTSSEFVSIPNVHFCLKFCLDMIGCRATTFDHITSRCTYHGSVCDGVVDNENNTFIQRICKATEPLKNVMQTCHNCANGPDCQMYFDSRSNTRLDYECVDTCVDSTDCGEVFYGTRWSMCRLYQCGQIKHKIGQTVYKKASHTDCPEYEIFEYSDTCGTCNVIGTSQRASGIEFCMERCLDLVNCRGTTYVAGNTSCQHHSCDSHVTSIGATYMKRVCRNEFPPCAKNKTQTCLNCQPGPDCQALYSFTHHSKPKEIVLTSLGVDPDLKIIWYDIDKSREKHMQCSQVDIGIGHTVHRATCSPDNECHSFEIFILYNHKGTCEVIGSMDGGLSLHYCIEKCLDMDGCRGTSFHETYLRCDFHSCDSYTDARNYTFMRRVCVNESNVCDANVIQTCLDCKIEANCQSAYEIVSDIYFAEDCLKVKINEYVTETGAVWFNRSGTECLKFQCSQVDMSIGGVVYRNSCNTDCPKYEIFILSGYRGTCSVIGFDEGGVNLNYCITKCLDMPGCRGTTYDSELLRCDYHNCSNRTKSSDLTFMEKRCITEDYCIRNYLQTCLDCETGPTCQRHYELQHPVYLWQDCEALVPSYNKSKIVKYRTKQEACSAFDCTEVTQQMFSTTYRKSCSTDCLKYKIFTIYGYEGTCGIIGSDEGGVTIGYCLEKCLDTNGCRAVSFEDAESRCYYHNCDTRTENSNFTFVKRVCESGTEPVKSFTQTCENCLNKCSNMTTQIGITVSSQCNTTCDNCDSVYYDTTTDTCKQSQCDIPYPVYGPRSTVYRKTANPYCPKYELFLYINVEADCNVIGYDEGVNDSLYCFIQCLDNPYCYSAKHHVPTYNCTYHSCKNGTLDLAASTYFLQKICINDCADMVTQVCHNCKVGPECQSSMATEAKEAPVCLAECEGNTSCEGIQYHHGNGTCSSYQCNEVTQEYGYTFNRRTCNHDDCPEYEIYEMDAHVGTCNNIKFEMYQLYPLLCMERCLDMPGCRAVTYYGDSKECFYHNCDCSENQPAVNAVFMWRYCIANASMVTVFNQTLPVPESMYPKAISNCYGTTVSPTTVILTGTTAVIPETTPVDIPSSTPAGTPSSTTAGIPSNTTAVGLPGSSTGDIPTGTPAGTPPSTTGAGFHPTGTTAGVPTSGITPGTTAVGSTRSPVAIYILPCVCSKGLFTNRTSEQIAQELITNLTIDATTTSATRRRKTSAKDDRPTSRSIGISGTVVITTVILAVVGLDMISLLKLKPVKLT